MSQVVTPRCFWCHKTGTLELPDDMAARVRQYIATTRQPRLLIQDAFPNLSADQREQIMTGTHPKCWDEIFQKKG